MQEAPFVLFLQDPQLPSPTAPAGGLSAPPPGAAGTQADGTNAPQQPASAPGGLGSMLLPFAVLILFMWFFVMRPERKRQKERATMLAAVKKGDHVVTAGGLYGVVVRMDEQTVTLKVDDNTRLRFDRSAVGRIASSKSGGKASGGSAAPEPALAASSR